MKTITLIISLLFGLMAYSQVSYRKAPETIEVITPYDSLHNVPLKNIKSFYGHDALILDLAHFYTTPDSDGTKPTEDIINKTYQVIEVIKDATATKQWIHLLSGTTNLYYQVSRHSIEKPSFIMLEYYEKQKQLKLNKQFKILTTVEFKELNTGIMTSFNQCNKFTCVDITILEDGNKLIPSYIIRNQAGEEIGVPLKGFDIISSRSVNRFDIQ